MSKFKDASENIKRLQVMFKGLIELAEVMDNVDSIENYITELENKKVSLTKYLVSIEESIKFSLLKLNSTNKEIETKKIQAEKQVEEILSQTEKHAEEINGKLILEKEKIQSTLNDEVKAFEIEIEELKDKSKTLSDEIELKELKLKEVTEALEKIKGKF